MNTKLTDMLRFVPGIASADLTAAAATPYVGIAQARRLLAAAQTTSLAATKTLTISFTQATDASGTGAKALQPTGANYITTQGATPGPVVATAEIKAEDLDVNNGYAFVSASVVSNNSAALPGSIVLILGDLRFAVAP